MRNNRISLKVSLSSTSVPCEIYTIPLDSGVVYLSQWGENGGLSKVQQFPPKITRNRNKTLKERNKKATTDKVPKKNYAILNYLNYRWLMTLLLTPFARFRGQTSAKSCRTWGPRLSITLRETQGHYSVQARPSLLRPCILRCLLYSFCSKHGGLSSYDQSAVLSLGNTHSSSHMFVYISN